MLYRRTATPTDAPAVRPAAEDAGFRRHAPRHARGALSAVEGRSGAPSRPRRFGTQERPRRSRAHDTLARSGPSSRLVRRPRLPHQQRQSTPEVLLRLVHVVRATPELDVLDRGRTTNGVGTHVVKLEEPALGTAPVRSDERAPATVAPPHLPPHGGRNVARARRGRSARTWTLGRRQLGPFEIGREERQRPIEDGSRVASRDRVTEQVLDSTELVVRLTRDHELHLVALRGQRRHDGRDAAASSGEQEPPELPDRGARGGAARGSRSASGAAADGAGAGSFRTDARTSGCGRRRATMCSTSRLLL